MADYFSSLLFYSKEKQIFFKEIDGLRAEFATLKTFVPAVTSQAAFDKNKECNRYNNVICYDHTRVVLKYLSF